MAQYSLGRSDTTEDVTGTFGRAEAGPDEGLALVVAWCRDEPERVGEVVVVAPGDGRAFVVGRGDEPPMDFEHVRAGLVRQRPGRNAVTAPLGARRLSREQLHVRRLDAERLAVENHGKRAMWVRGAETSHAVVGVGEAVVVEGQLVLYCARRPAALAGLLHLDDAALHAF
ncbi:MAG: hypothetical protein KC635_22370, partial [Myxococcales bacterium]|nr:hypothetical protein [Myxococcales bacterium]